MSLSVRREYIDEKFRQEHKIIHLQKIIRNLPSRVKPKEAKLHTIVNTAAIIYAHIKSNNLYIFFKVKAKIKNILQQTVDGRFTLLYLNTLKQSYNAESEHVFHLFVAIRAKRIPCPMDARPSVRRTLHAPDLAQ